VQLVIKRCHLAHMFLRRIRRYLDVEARQILLQTPTGARAKLARVVYRKVDVAQNLSDRFLIS